MIPTVVTRAVVADELPAVRAWVARHPGWAAAFDDLALDLDITTTHLAAGVPLRIRANLHGYRAIPPAWQFLHPVTLEPDPAVFPQPGNHPMIQGSIFHSNKVICAPWNRLAFQENGGPHQDWGGLTNWTKAAPSYTKADTLADVLSQIELHLSVSPGMYP